MEWADVQSDFISLLCQFRVGNKIWPQQDDSPEINAHAGASHVRTSAVAFGSQHVGESAEALPSSAVCRLHRGCRVTEAAGAKWVRAELRAQPWPRADSTTSSLHYSAAPATNTAALSLSPHSINSVLLFHFLSTVNKRAAGD